MQQPDKKTDLYKYIRTEMIFAFILIGMTLIVATTIVIINPEHFAYMIGLGLMAINFSLQRYDAVKRGINITRIKNMQSLFESERENFQMLITAWKDKDFAEVAKYKSKWEAILSTAYTMKKNGLITQEAYTLMLESHIKYVDQETKIILDTRGENERES